MEIETSMYNIINFGFQAPLCIAEQNNNWFRVQSTATTIDINILTFDDLGLKKTGTGFKIML